LGANVVCRRVQQGEPAHRPTSRAWAIIRRADRALWLTSSAPAGSTAATSTEPTVPAELTNPGVGDGSRWLLTPPADLLDSGRRTLTVDGHSPGAGLFA
jgi:hypothetical protein